MRSALLLLLVARSALAQPTPNGGGTARATRFVSTSSSIRVSNGQANFSCPNNPATSSPCLSNPNKPLELGGVHATTPQDDSSAIYMGCMENKDGGSCLEVLNNFGLPGGGTEFQLARFMYNGDLRVARHFYMNTELGTDARLITPKGPFYFISDGSQGTAGPLYFWNKASSDVAEFFTGSGGTSVLLLGSDGKADLLTGPSSNSCTLDGASPSKCTITTFANAKCTCSTVGTSAPAACGVNLVTTTLTAYSANGLTNVVNITCH